MGWFRSGMPAYPLLICEGRREYLSLLIGSPGSGRCRPNSFLPPRSIDRVSVESLYRSSCPAFFEGNRGDTFMVQGKIFPEGTLPAGTAAFPT